MRTSQTDPIQIAEVRCGAGVVGVTFCPGKSGPSVFGSPWARDLAMDLAELSRWSPSAILTLMKPHELDGLGVSDLGQAVRQAGIRWLHAPIKDVGVPNAGFEARWALLGHLLRQELLAGRKVLVHCRGGRGRAGMIAARLLVELGEDPEKAISQVRAVRPGAIETRAQEDHVRSVRPVGSHDRADRIWGCLLGGAVGDAFGYAVEFDRLARIREKHGPEGLTEPELTDGKFVVSDDTQMTLFTAEALARASEPDDFLEECRAAYLRWHETQSGRRPPSATGLLRHDCLWARRAPGMTCMSALAAGGNGSPERPLNNSKGCGGVMRTAPIGLMGWGEEVAFDLGARASALTHGHPSGYFSGGAMAAMVATLVTGDDLLHAARKALTLLSDKAGAEETFKALAAALETAESTSNRAGVADGALGEGWVGEEALAIGVYAAFVADDFADAMKIAANHDGDSDSTASIAGQLYGAWKGTADIPWEWVERLDVLDAICEAAVPLLKGERDAN
ncbi:MAG TPA: ADP-ribosylglycohydrolase family protein [Brevundimonas sp.]|jgi:ADP-ribosylglycohydrolase|uniref:ADP-ribosylglycohydrolase family protein n=1 Tax=Brevundimonas sp. TaxID=1871086 RepID=UPI002DE97989|nr:ADP-ribosylglycohydrolase family protein [Brevundimonas sp.]